MPTDPPPHPTNWKEKKKEKGNHTEVGACRVWVGVGLYSKGGPSNWSLTCYGRLRGRGGTFSGNARVCGFGLLRMNGSVVMHIVLAVVTPYCNFVLTRYYKSKSALCIYALIYRVIHTAKTTTNASWTSTPWPLPSTQLKISRYFQKNHSQFFAA